jgi:hypothetical protein
MKLQGQYPLQKKKKKLHEPVINDLGVQGKAK